MAASDNNISVARGMHWRAGCEKSRGGEWGECNFFYGAVSLDRRGLKGLQTVENVLRPPLARLTHT